MSLQATVQKLRNRVEDQRAIAADREGFIKTWQSDVSALYQQFAEALQPFVEQGVAQVYRGSTVMSEEELGSYLLQTLVIEIVGRRMLLLPIARLTITGTGRVDLYREDRPAEDDRVLIVRGTEDASFDPKTWIIQDRRPTPDWAHRLDATVGQLRGGRRYLGLNTASIQDGVDFLLNL